MRTKRFGRDRLLQRENEAGCGESRTSNRRLTDPGCKSRIVPGIDGEFLHPGPESCTVDTYARGGSIGAAHSPF
jgi:hypothetical protein